MGTTRRIRFHVSRVSFPPGHPEPPSSFTALALWRRTGLSFCGTSPECLLAAHDPMRAGHWQERRGRRSGVSSACASGGPPCSFVASPGVLTWSLGEDDVRGGSRHVFLFAANARSVGRYFVSIPLSTDFHPRILAFLVDSRLAWLQKGDFSNSYWVDG